jgi:hypothetical protein
MVTNLKLEKSDIFKSFLILNLTCGKLALKNLDFFIKESEFIISSNQLSTKNVSLVDGVLVGLLESFILIIRILDDKIELFNLI